MTYGSESTVTIRRGEHCDCGHSRAAHVYAMLECQSCDCRRFDIRPDVYDDDALADAMVAEYARLTGDKP